MKSRRNRLLSNGLFCIIVFVILLAGVNWAVGGPGSNGSTENIRYSQLVKDLKTGKVKSINVQPSNGVYTVTESYKKAQELKNRNNTGLGLIPSSQSSSEVTRFNTTVLQNDSVVKTASGLTQKNGASISGRGESQSRAWISITVMLVPTLIFIVILWMMMDQGEQDRGGGAMNFRRSHVKPQDPSKNKARFSDVADEEEEKQELVEVVESLKNPAKCTKLGVRVPADALLESPPDTDKTLLACATTDEAGVPFYSIPGSDFVEVFVDVGASRVCDLFETAKKNAPSIIFIDETDAVGRKRGDGVSGGHDERGQTLNQLLVEMDGFESDEGVIIMAATNRSDVLDPALLRPGRFDCKVSVGRPDVKGRKVILEIHAKNKPLAPDVDLKKVAHQTPGFVGTNLENALNEAALIAARRNKTEITASDIDEAENRVIAGPAKKDTVISPEERKRVAYHEAGHAIVGLVLNDSGTVRKVTTAPRGRTGGYNIMLPKENEDIITRKQLMEQVAGLMSGRAGKEVVVGDKSTGASNDFEQATNIARGIVTQYGMADVGMTEPESPNMQSPYETKPYSEATAVKIDEAVREILDEGHKQAVDIIRSHHEIHRVTAGALLKYETLNEKQILSLFKTGKMSEDDENEFPNEFKASTYERAKAAMEKKDQQREETESKDGKEDVHPLSDNHKNVDGVLLNPPSEKKDSDKHNPDENGDK